MKIIIENKQQTVRVDTISDGMPFSSSGRTYIKVVLPKHLHPELVYVYALHVDSGYVDYFTVNTQVMPLNLAIDH